MTHAVVLLHGLGGSPATWDRVCPLLSGPVLVPEVEGSDSIEQDALDIARRIRSAGFDAVTVVGHSRGGLVATSLAQQYPSLVTRVVLVSTPPTVSSRLTARGLSETVLKISILGDIAWSSASVKSLKRGLRSAYAPGGPVPQFAVDDLSSTGLERFRTSTSAIDHYLDDEPLAERLAALTCPVAMVYGLDDRRVDSTEMAVCAGGPRIEAHPLAREGHGAPWSSAGAVAAVVSGDAATSPAAKPATTSKPHLRPRRWTPPRATARATEKASVHPMGAIRRIELPGRGPEDVRLDSQGRVLTGLEDGRIVRVTLVDDATSTVETLADTAGRPLGMTVVDDATLLVCDSERGVLRVDLDSGDVDVVVDRLDGEPITFASNVIQGKSGNIYFTVSTRRFGFHDFLADLLEHSGTGRLAVLDHSGNARTLVDGIQFANGLAVSEAEDSALVVATGDFSLSRIPLFDRRSGAPVVVAENLPAFPDNLSVDGDLIWLAMATPRSALHDRVARLPGFVRRASYFLPEQIRQGESTTWVIAMDRRGVVVHDLQSQSPEYSMVTSVVRRGPQLILGSVSESALALVDAPRSVTQ